MVSVSVGARSIARPIVVVMALLGLPLASACGVMAGTPSACDGLVYKASGLTRAQYLPCAAEMMTALDRTAEQVEKMLSGDEKARSEAQANLGDLRNLLKKAGGRNMLERWDDRALTSLNVDIWNAFNHHAACMLVARQMFGAPPLGDEKYRNAARAECSAYREAYQDARAEFRRLR